MASATSSNVQVAVRCRPFNDKEKERKCARVVKMSGRKTTIHNPGSGTGQKERDFFYDHCYFWDTKSETVYEDLGEPLLNKALDGYNATIFAYGQTGSGKTYGMTGTPSEPGIIPRMNRRLFQLTEDAQNKEFLITVSYLEIYQEVIYDLLNPHGKDMKVREHPKLGIYVEGLAELVVRNSEDIARLQEQGNRVRKMASTEMNKQSSRSHSVFTIVIQQKDTDAPEGRGLRARINLVDLAGSERVERTGAEGQTLKEGAAINKSLAALGNVINALAKKGGHIPYRDSKLTRILQESLGGNCLTVMIAMVSPADVNFSETLSTLQYADRAKNIQNTSRKNEDETSELIRQLREEIAGLRSKLEMGGTDKRTNTRDELGKMEEMIRSLQLAKQQTWEEKERLSSMYEDERHKNLANKGILEWVMDTVKKENKEVQARMQQLQKQKEQLTAEYKQKRKTVDDLKSELSTKIERYSELSKDPNQSDLAKQCLGEIHQLKETYKKENAKLKEVRQNVQQIQEQKRQAQEDAQAHTTFLAGNAEFRELIQKEEMERLRQENEATLTEEKERMRMEIEQERAELQLRFTQGSEVNAERMMKLEMDMVEMKAEHAVMTVQLEQMESEKQKLQQDLENAYRRQREMRDELEIQQLQHFQTFRSYRMVFEEQKASLEQRYRSLLEESIQDAVYLSARNTELQQENQHLKKDLAVLRGQT